MKITRTDHRIGSRILLVFGALMALCWFARSPSFDASGTGRKPLVIVAGQTEQIQAADYISSVGGVTTNATAAGTGDLETTTATASTTLTAGGQFATAGTLTITTWGTGQTLNDWNPAGLATANVISVQQSSGTTNITGIAAQPTGTEITIYNREASVGVVELEYETGSSSGNQFVLPGTAALGFNWKIQPGGSIKLRYGGSNWQIAGYGATEVPYLLVDNGALINGALRIGSLFYNVQYDTSTGTQDPFVLFNTTTLLVWSGTSDMTIKGMYGNADGHHVCIVNVSTGHTLTLGNQNGAGSVIDLYNFGDIDQSLVGPSSSACFDYQSVPVASWYMTSFVSQINAGPTSFSSTTNKGTIMLSTGTGTATVQAGAVCTCTDTTTAALVACAVSSTTLTATGVGSDVIAYLCF